MALATPTREDFAALLEESFQSDALQEGAVVKGKIVAIEKDIAVIDVGAKTEGRVPLKEFTLPGRDSTLGPIDTGPFYAVEVISSCLGTKGGPRTTVTGQVIDVDGAPIPGLYAAGNSASTVMGTRYAGAGATIAPAMVFGFLAGESIAQDAGIEVTTS